MKRPDQLLIELCRAAIQEAKDNGITRAEMADLAHRAMEGDADARGRYIEAVRRGASGSAHNALYATATPEFLLAALTASEGETQKD